MSDAINDVTKDPLPSPDFVRDVAVRLGGSDPNLVAVIIYALPDGQLIFGGNNDLDTTTRVMRHALGVAENRRHPDHGTRQ